MARDEDPGPGGGVGDWADAERLLRALGHAVIATDLEGRIVRWNDAAERLYGWTAEEILGRDIAEVTVPEAGQEHGDEIMRALRGGRPWSGGFTVVRKDGSTFSALVTDVGVRDDDGRLVGIVGVSTDLGHALRPLLARSSDAVLVTSRDGAVSYASPAFTRLFGWSPESVHGVRVQDLVHPDDRAVALGPPAPDRHGGPSAPECRLRCPDGSWRRVEMVVTDLLDDPAVAGRICNVRDVTERQEAQDRLAELNEQLETALASRVVIEQAKGVLAERRGISVDEAFRVLRKHARDRNASLKDVATAVVTLGLAP
ncbi:PAS domain S-box protein [Geodermatophilus marinus]|uniref:PAS domain S-box protein n=1 Tax=Geodermatophilus sp. LHW52908 TaxID=2303986 RepID=UPI000E3C7743|nr:PAS domain S-box protein [Geodermatophilus sp. LHW52908]RFU19199.1 PAS domain S-box protein [Geodermatophilus sp. LHW52908]